MTKKQAIQLFEERKVRTVWDDQEEKWYFSIVDVCGVLTDSKDALTARKYWNKLKQRLKEEGNETVTNCHQLKMRAADGKMRLTDVADTEQLWKRTGVKEGLEYASLTDIITREWSGFTTKQYKHYKGLKKENLRDNMTNLEIALNILAEASATELSKDRNPKGYNAQTQVAKEGGSVAKAARKQLESKLGRSVITKDKASDYLLPKKNEQED